MTALETLRTFLDHGWVGSIIAIAGFLIGIVGIVAASWTYKASQIGGRLVYQIGSLQLIGVPDGLLAKDVEVKFRGKVVDRLSKTQIIFWNSGNSLAYPVNANTCYQ